MQRFLNDGRRNATEGETAERVVAELSLGQVQQQRGGERPLNDQATIAFLAARVRSVVVDTVAVERQRRIAEQQRLRRYERPMRVPSIRIEARA
jgi:hypothetical protein